MNELLLVRLVARRQIGVEVLMSGLRGSTSAFVFYPLQDRFFATERRMKDYLKTVIGCSLRL